MKKYLISRNGKLVYEKRSGRPKEIHVQVASFDEDPRWLKVVDKIGEFGETYKEVEVDAVAKATAQAEDQAKEDAASAIAYKGQRKAEYPAIGDQLDALHKKLHLGDSTEYDAIAASIEATKTKYPKPE